MNFVSIVLIRSNYTEDITLFFKSISIWSVLFLNWLMLYFKHQQHLPNIAIELAAHSTVLLLSIITKNKNTTS